MTFGLGLTLVLIVLDLIALGVAGTIAADTDRPEPLLAWFTITALLLVVYLIGYIYGGGFA